MPKIDFKIGCGLIHWDRDSGETEPIPCGTKKKGKTESYCYDCSLRKEGYEAGQKETEILANKIIHVQQKAYSVAGWNSALDQAEIDIGVLLNTEIGITAEEEQLIRNVFLGLKK